MDPFQKSPFTNQEIPMGGSWGFPGVFQNYFGRVQIVLVMSKLFWLGQNHFGQVYIRLLWTNFYDLDLSKMIWTRPKQIGPVQNDWYLTKMIWTVQSNK